MLVVCIILLGITMAYLLLNVGVLRSSWWVLVLLVLCVPYVWCDTLQGWMDGC